eukprot:COSAG01_NODE_1712_length_9409_cov_4.588077_1_plen_63_part_00
MQWWWWRPLKPMEPEPEPVTEPQEPEDSIKNAVGYTKAVADATKLAEVCLPCPALPAHRTRL